MVFQWKSVFLPGSANDVRALNALPLNLSPGSEVYTDSAYTDYTAEDDLDESSQIELKVMRKKNSKRHGGLTRTKTGSLIRDIP